MPSSTSLLKQEPRGGASEGQPGPSRTQTPTFIADGNGGFRVNANFAFPSSLGCACVAEFPVEFQVLWGGQFKSFDRIVVRVV